MDKFGGSFEQTPLALVCGEMEGSNIELVHRFVSAGADIAALDDDDLLPIHRAIRNERILVLEYFVINF